MENLNDDRENLNDFLEKAELQQYNELFRDILKVTKISQLKYVVTEDLAQIGLSKPEQRRYKKIYSKYFPKSYITKFKKLIGTKKTEPNQHSPSTIPLDVLSFPENNVKVPTKHIISIEDITINKELGMGQFGVVQLGTWNTGNQRLQVAIKCLGHERMTSNSTEFLKEAAVMHSIEHPNIVRLYGVVLHMDSLMLVTELAPLRSLLECLREATLRPKFTVPNLCEFAEQICDGMTYLENKRLIHRDLAARNILVFNKDSVKISDFGLSRALGVGKDYYQTNYDVNLKLPVAWCAPECILYLRFTSSSDVWAFGVCLWEMFTYGFQPWAAFSGQQILEAIDAPKFQRLDRPECCPELYYTAMLECWAQDPNTRPKFKDLGPKLREIRPDEVQAIADFEKPEEGRRPGMLDYKSGQIITVLGKENMTNSSLWYGVLGGGACGMFDPSQTKPYNPPRQIVTPYKPLEDLEQQPLINPNSPSHLSGACASPYPLLQGNKSNCDEVDLPYGETRIKSSKRTSHKSSEPTTSKSILNKVKSATLGRRSHKTEDGTAPKSDEVHEYYEISETDTESNATDNVRTDNLLHMENHGITKTCGEFGQSLLDEMDAIFHNLNGKRRDEPAALGKHFDIDSAIRSHTLNKMEKKRGFQTGTMKPMSAHDEKTLDTAVALANEITTKSMTDLEGEHKLPHSPNDRSKFHFKFPHLSLHNAHEHDKDANGKQERRNFSEEAQNVPDIQSTITEESKLAYTSLIEDPTPYYPVSHGTIPKLPIRECKSTFHTLQIPRPFHNRIFEADINIATSSKNILPLPPRNTKPKLVDKPRHVRKHPLRSPPELPPKPPSLRPIIYQNASPQIPNIVITNGADVCDGKDTKDTKLATNPFTNATSANPFICLDDGIDDVDCGIDYDDGTDDDDMNDDDLKDLKEGMIKDCTDHVSVEDLSEFAGLKPCGRQRGVESDEVRIMSKVLKQMVTPEECLAALELSDWNVYEAIKVVRVKISVGEQIKLEDCSAELEKASGDIGQATAVLVLKKDEINQK